jgi:general secretion pathway protein L
VKIVGLKIDKGMVAASVVLKTFRQVELKGSFSLPFTTDAELVEILKERSKDWAGARIVSSIPGHYFSQRTIPFPFADHNRVEKALPFEIEDSVPFPLDDVVLDHVILDGAADGKGTGGQRETPVLGLMLPKVILRRHLDLLAGAGLDPQVIVPSYVGLYSISKMMKTEGCTLFVCDRDLCIKCGETVKGLRSFSGLQTTAGLRHTLQALETEYKERVEKASLLCPDSGVEAELSALGIVVEQVAPEFSGSKAADPVSLGLALSEHLNFRNGEFTYRAADEGLRRKKRTLIIAGAVALALAAVNVGVKLYVVESGYGKLDREMKQIYRQTFPDAKTVADPLRQMRDKLEEAKRKFGVLGSGSSALDVMRAVTDGVPKEVRVSFQEFSLEGDRLKLQAEAGSFEAVDKIKAELQKAPLFSDVIVQDTRMGVENKVKFRMEIKLKQGI